MTVVDCAMIIVTCKSGLDNPITSSWYFKSIFNSSISSGIRAISLCSGAIGNSMKIVSGERGVAEFTVPPTLASPV